MMHYYLVYPKGKTAHGQTVNTIGQAMYLYDYARRASKAEFAVAFVNDHGVTLIKVGS